MTTPMIVGTILDGVAGIIDDIWTSDEERAKFALDVEKLQLERDKGQIAVNVEEAKHSSLWVAGARPAILWIGAAAMAYQFIIYPFLVWGWVLMQSQGLVPATLTPPPMLDTDALWVILSGILGIAGMRSFDKTKGTAK